MWSTQEQFIISQKKGRGYLPEVLRQIRTYLPEVLRQIRSYLPEVLRQIRSYFPEVLWQIRSYLQEVLRPPAYKKLFAGALSLLCSPEWSHAALFSLSFYCIVLYSLVRSFKGLYWCITVLSSLVLYDCATSWMDFFGYVWPIRNLNIFLFYYSL